MATQDMELIMSEELKNKISQTRINKGLPPKKPVIQLSINNDFINEHISVNEALKYLNTKCPTRLIDCLKKRIKTYRGFKWVYKEEYVFFKKL